MDYLEALQRAVLVSDRTPVTQKDLDAIEERFRVAISDDAIAYEALQVMRKYNLTLEQGLKMAVAAMAERHKSDLVHMRELMMALPLGPVIFREEG